MARVNLATRPALKNGPSAVEWFGPGDWARSTSLHASLPRSTGFAGTTAGDIQMTRGDGIPGRWYVWSASVRCVSPNSIVTKTNFYLPGNVYNSTVDGNAYDQAGSTTRRVVSGVAQCPPGCDSVRPVIDQIDGSMQVTAVLIEEYLTEADAIAALASHATPAWYFDGDGDGVGNTGSGWSWDGTDGESSSTSTVLDPATGTVPFAAMTITGAGVRRSFSTGGITPFGAMSITSGALVTASYDARRGRVRVRAAGLPDPAIRVVVYSRVVGRSRWSVVRGGKQALVAAEGGKALARPVDDYEYRAGAAMEYRLVALSSPENSTDAVVVSKTVLVDDIADHVWVKFIAAPYLNKRVSLHAWSDVTREENNAVFKVRNRKDPVAVTDVHSGRSMEIQVAVQTIAARDALENALGAGSPIFLQVPDSLSCPTMYAKVGSFSWRSLSRFPGRERHLFTIPLTEVAPPPPSIVGQGRTWATVRAQYASWADLGDDLNTWAEVVG
jgi:hypothetical protein